MLKNCFGSRARLAGQNRVPDPPAMITMYVASIGILSVRRGL